MGYFHPDRAGNPDRAVHMFSTGFYVAGVYVMPEFAFLDNLIKWGISPMLAIALIANIIQYRTNTKLIEKYNEVTRSILDQNKFLVERIKGNGGNN